MEKELYEIIADCINKLIANIDEYVENFINIYNESNDSFEIQKDISKLNEQLELAKKKKDKNFNLYVDEIITKSEFSERNDQLNKSILDINQQLNELNNAVTDSSEYLKEVNEIRKFVKNKCTERITPSDSAFQELIKSMIRRIDVTPVDPEHMKLDIFLKSGNVENGVIERSSALSRSGKIRKKMIESYEQQSTK